MQKSKETFNAVVVRRSGAQGDLKMVEFDHDGLDFGATLFDSASDSSESSLNADGKKEMQIIPEKWVTWTASPSDNDGSGDSQRSERAEWKELVGQRIDLADRLREEESSRRNGVDKTSGCSSPTKVMINTDGRTKPVKQEEEQIAELLARVQDGRQDTVIPTHTSDARRLMGSGITTSHASIGIAATGLIVLGFLARRLWLR